MLTYCLDDMGHGAHFYRPLLPGTRAADLLPSNQVLLLTYAPPPSTRAVELQTGHNCLHAFCPPPPYLTPQWIFDLVIMFMRPPRLIRINALAKRLLLAISPHYCFATGISAVAQTAPAQPGVPPLPPPFGPGGKPHGAFDWEVSGRPLAHMGVQGLVYMAAVLLLDSGLLVAGWAWARHRLARAKKQPPTHQSAAGRAAGDVEQAEGGSLRSPLLLPAHHPQDEEGEPEDADVAAERQAVVSGQKRDSSVRFSAPLTPLLLWLLATPLLFELIASSQQVLLTNVRKSYYPRGPFGPPLRAVRGLWLGVQSGECFGLLGVNGAGKTSTFRVLTGEEAPDPDGGDAALGGASITTQRSVARRMLGYCPQFEGLPLALTGRELLSLYARCGGWVMMLDSWRACMPPSILRSILQSHAVNFHTTQSMLTAPSFALHNPGPWTLSHSSSANLCRLTAVVSPFLRPQAAWCPGLSGPGDGWPAAGPSGPAYWGCRSPLRGVLWGEPAQAGCGSRAGRGT